MSLCWICSLHIHSPTLQFIFSSFSYPFHNFYRAKNLILMRFNLSTFPFIARPFVVKSNKNSLSNPRNQKFFIFFLKFYSFRFTILITRFQLIIFVRYEAEVTVLSSLCLWMSIPSVLFLKWSSFLSCTAFALLSKMTWAYFECLFLSFLLCFIDLCVCHFSSTTLPWL